MEKTSSRITVAEITRDMALSPVRVYQLLNSQIIPNIKFGRRYIITRHAYEEWKKTCGREQPVGARRLAS